MQDNNPPREIKNMTTPHLRESIGRSPLRLGFFLPALAVACFALMPFAQSAQAVGPEPNGGDLIGNVTEEDNAVLELGSDTVEAAMGQVAENPNKRVIPIIIKKPLQCAGGDVILHGDLVVSFKAVSPPRNGARVIPLTLKLERFRGKAVNGKIERKLVAMKPERIGHFGESKVRPGFFAFSFEFVVTGPGLPGGSPLRFAVRYSPNLYKYENGKVTNWIPDKTPSVRCR
jgi:hypothetical protein